MAIGKRNNFIICSLKLRKMLGWTEAQQLFMNMVEGWIWTEADKKSFELRQRDGNKWKQEQALIVCRLKMYVQNLFCLNVQKSH